MVSRSILWVFVSLLLRQTNAKWYSRPYICQTGDIETVMRDKDGGIVFVQYFNNETNEIDDDSSNNNDRRQVRRRTFALVTPRVLQEGTTSSSSNSNSTTTEGEESVFHVRECLCHSSQYDDLYSQDVNILLCPADSDFCAVQVSEGEDVECYSVTVTEVVARNAWPLILLWYGGVIVICCCTVHGQTAKDYVKAYIFPTHNETITNRLLTGDSARSQGRWTWYREQRFRFESQIMARANWIWQNEEDERFRGLPGLGLQIKTKIFKMEDDMDKEEESIHQSSEEQQNDTSDDMSDGENDDSETTTCTICLAPLQSGDRVGALECHHNFHIDCLKQWSTRKNACPLCAKRIAKVIVSNQARQEQQQQQPEQQDSNQSTRLFSFRHRQNRTSVQPQAPVILL